MDKYNIIDDEYIAALKAGIIRYAIKIQTLDHWENVVGEITTDLIPQSCSVSVNKQQGARRAASIAVYDNNRKYTPSVNSDFWYNRKFKVLSGIKIADKVRWFSVGVFIPTEAQGDGKTLTVSAADKFGNLNGETKTGVCDKPFTTDIASGDIYVAELIREVLMIDIGNGLPIDPVPPKIDAEFETTALYHDITLNAGQYYGEIITELADMYGADVYYDSEGALVFTRKTTTDIPSWYQHLGHIWNFGGELTAISEGSTSYKLDGVNAVTVTTDNSEGEIYSYTARNQNAESPINVKAVGEHFYETVPVYINAGDTSVYSGEEKCREYAEYLLMQSTVNSVSEAFTYPIIPHFDVDCVVGYRDKDYMISQINFDFGSLMMSLELCNINFLPSNHNISSYD